MENFLYAGFGAFLALAGALIQALVGRHHSQSDRHRELLIDAYNDYLTGLAKRASIFHEHSNRTEAATALMVTGKQKISAYAPAVVVISLANLEKTPMSLSSKATQTAMVELVKSMRQSLNAETGELDLAIHTILFSNPVIVSE